MTAVDEMTVRSVQRYLGQIDLVLQKLPGAKRGEAALAVQIAPDMFDTGFHFAIAIQFAARALCPPAGMSVPEIPEVFTVETLRRYAAQVSDLIAPITADDLTHVVRHEAGAAQMQHAPAEYVTGFALPNMIFHFTMAYAGLRQAGVQIGKADFDGYHVY